jgi:hypothetical protein
MMNLAEKKALLSVHEAASYNAERWDKTHKDHDFRVGDMFLILTVNFNNLGGNRKLKDNFVGPFVIKAFHGRNAVEVELTEGFDLKHPTFLVSLVKRFVADTNLWQDNKSTSAPPIVLPPVGGLDDTDKYPSKILDEKIVRVQGQDTRLYLNSFKNLPPDCDKWLQKGSIAQTDKLLRAYRASNRRAQPSGIRAVLFWGGASVRSVAQLRSTHILTKIKLETVSLKGLRDEVLRYLWYREPKCSDTSSSTVLVASEKS